MDEKDFHFSGGDSIVQDGDIDIYLREEGRNLIRLRFPAARILDVREKNGQCEILRTDGLKIQVDLPFDELCAKLSRPDGRTGVVDLRPYTNGMLPTDGTHEIGQPVERKGIYAGVVALRDENARLLGRFNLFAAPADYGGKDSSGKLSIMRMDFATAAYRISQEAPFFDIKGISAEEKELLRTIAAKAYKGKWFIPTRSMLEALYFEQDVGAFAGTFRTQDYYDHDTAYWSSSPYMSSGKCCKKFQGGEEEIVNKESSRLVRLVRLEPLP